MSNSQSNKKCPSCGTDVPIASAVCPNCNYQFVSRYAPPSSMPRPYEPAEAKVFRDVDEFLEFFNSIPITDDRVGNMNSSYSQIKINTDTDNTRYITAQDTCWLGKPMPTSIDDALSRTRYLRMDDFNNIYRTEIMPRIDELLKNSKADLEQPTISYNDKGLGVFDFGRASTGLKPIYKYYSFQKKDFVDGKECKFVKGVRYKLKSDGSPVVIIPKLKTDDKKLIDEIYKQVYDGQNIFKLLKKYKVRIGGSDSISSSTKKVYQLKEKKLKPRNAVKIFVQIGYPFHIPADDNCDSHYSLRSEGTKWMGYAAIGIAEILTALGYQVSINAIYGVECPEGLNVGGGNLVDNGRVFLMWNMKKFEETLDSGSLLHFLSDASFFRITIFDVIIKTTCFRKDTLTNNLNWVVDRDGVENFVFSKFAKKDKIFLDSGKTNPTSPMLYYVIGSVYSLEDLRNIILDIGVDVVQKNKLAREVLGIK